MDFMYASAMCLLNLELHTYAGPILKFAMYIFLLVQCIREYRRYERKLKRKQTNKAQETKT